MALCALLVSAATSYAVDCDDLPPCGGKAPRNAWKYVMLVDGSGSMVTEDLWEPMKDAVKAVIEELPPNALLEIAIFDARKSGGRGSALQPFYGDGRGGPPLPFDLATAEDRERASQAIDLLPTPESSRFTPLYWALDHCLKEQERWLDGDQSKQFHIYLYSDGADTFKGGTVSQRSLRARIKALEHSISLINGLSDWCQIVIGSDDDKEKARLKIPGLEVIDLGDENLVPIPIAPPTAALLAPDLAPARGGTTTANLHLRVPCPDYMPGDITLAVEGTAPGVQIRVAPESFPTVGNERIVPITLTVTGVEGKVRDAQQAELIVRFPDTHCSDRFLQEGSRETRVAFSIAKDDSFTLDAGQARVRPQVAMTDRDVTILYQRPISGVSPTWSRSDGGPIEVDPDNPWAIRTAFAKPGAYDVMLSGTRAGSTAVAETTIPIDVLDFELSLEAPSTEVVEGKPVEVHAIASGSATAIGYRWRVNGVPLAEATATPTVTVTPNQYGPTEVAVRAKVRVGKRVELTGWASTSFDVREAPRVRVQVPHVAAWCLPVDVQAVTHGGVRRVTFSLIDTQGETLKTSQAAVLTKKREDERAVSLAESKLEVPAREGVYRVQASAQGHPEAIDQAEIQIIHPVVSLRALGDADRKLQLDADDQLTVAVVSDPPGVVDKVTWRVAEGAGVTLQQISPSGGETAPMTVADGSLQASLEIRFSAGTSVQLDRPVRIVATPHICGQGPSAKDAVSFERTPVFEMPDWHVVSNSSRPDVPWLARESFAVEPRLHIADDGSAIHWMVRAKDGRVVAEQRGRSVFEHEVDCEPGEYTVAAAVTPALGGQTIQATPLTLTVRHDPPQVTATFPEGTVMRGGQSLPVTITIAGAVERAEWSTMAETNSSDGGAAWDDLPEITRGSGSRSATIHVPAHPDGAGETKTRVRLHPPYGDRVDRSIETLMTRPPRKLWQFVVSCVGLLFMVVLIVRRCWGNGPRHWRLLASVDRDSVSRGRRCRRIEISARKGRPGSGWWDAGEKMAHVPLEVINSARWPRGQDARPGEWFASTSGFEIVFGAGGTVDLQPRLKRGADFRYQCVAGSPGDRDRIWALTSRDDQGFGCSAVYFSLERRGVFVSMDRLVMLVAVLVAVGVAAWLFQLWMQ